MIGCGGVGLQVVAALRLAGASPIVAVDLDPAKLELALARGATHAVESGSAATAARVLRITGRGADHAFEVVGRPETMRLAWDVSAARRHGGRRRPRPEGRRSRAARDRVPLRQGRSAARTTATGTPLGDLPQLAELALSGELDLAGVVTHVEPLEAVNEALDRLRIGDGVRTVLVLDAELAGHPAHR